MTNSISELPPTNPRSCCCLQTFSRVLLAVAIVLVLGVAIVYLLLALPAYDDFVRMTEPRRLGFWNYFRVLYFGWQGRWASYGLEATILPLGDATKTYPALIGAVVLLDLLGIYVICRCFTRSVSRGFSLICTLGLAAILWAQMPSVAQVVYWFTGAVENAMVLSLAGMLLVGLIFKRATIPWMIFATFLAIVICGLHEAYGAMLCIALTVGTVTAYWMGSENRLAWPLVLVAAACGLAIVVLAPGNHPRMLRDGGIHSREFMYDLRLAAAQFWTSGREWLFDPKLLAASLWIAFSPKLESARPVWPDSARVPWRWIIPLTWLAMLGVGFFGPSWAFGKPMPPRTLSGNFMVFAIGWLLIVFIWTRRLDARDSTAQNSQSLRSAAAASIAILVLASALILTGNFQIAARDLASRHVHRWRSATEQRYALLAKPGQDNRLIPPLPLSSRMLLNGEITPDARDIRNWSMAHFFHLEHIRTSPPPATRPAEESANP